MITFLNTIAELGGLTALTFIIIFFFAVREGYNFCIWVKTEILDKYHNKKNKTESTEEQFNVLKQMNEKEDHEIEQLRKDINELREEQKMCHITQRTYHLAIIRNTLYHIYNRCKKYGYIDQAEYETFESLRNIYLDNGGNSIFKHKIIPYLESLTIKGIEYEEKGQNFDEDE